MKITDFPLLLVEADPSGIARVQEVLAQANLVNPLRIVNHGRKAIAYLSGQEEFADRESHPFPSLVLLDLAISKPSGMEVLAWIRSQQDLKNLPVILLTSSVSDQSDSPSSSPLAKSPCLAKPVDAERLMEVMKAIGMYWMILDKTMPDAGQVSVQLPTRRVLVVDRDADFLRSIGEALHRRTPPIQVETALDVAAALRRLASTSFDALVYERSIGGTEDFDFLNKIRTASTELPVFILSPESDEGFAMRAVERGVRGVLTKQIRHDVFSDQLHDLLMTAKPPVPPNVSPPSDLEPTRTSTVAVPHRAHRKSAGTTRRQDTDILGNQIAFQSTSWDLVRLAPKVEALDALIRIYWKPLYFFVRQRGFGNEEAKDIVQEFLAVALEHGMIPRADPLRGRFRTFLLAALNNFLKDRHRFWGRQKRGSGNVPMSLDLDLGEPRVARAASGGEPPETIVDRAWAKGLLGQCISELVGKPAHLQAFNLQMLGVDYVSIGKTTGLTETAAKTAVHRLRVRLRGIIRSHLHLQNATEEEVGREVAEFASLLA
jgi:RNA polymerase sigma-70 factor (ECF subfamily)